MILTGFGLFLAVHGAAVYYGLRKFAPTML